MNIAYSTFKVGAIAGVCSRQASAPAFRAGKTLVLGMVRNFTLTANPWIVTPSFLGLAMTDESLRGTETSSLNDRSAALHLHL
jgi:hypothetical protein